MEQPLLAREDLDEGAVPFNARYLAGIDPAGLHIGDELFDYRLRLAAGIQIDGQDIDLAIGLDIDLYPCFLGDLVDHPSTGADDIANLVHIDLHGDHPRGIG